MRQAVYLCWTFLKAQADRSSESRRVTDSRGWQSDFRARGARLEPLPGDLSGLIALTDIAADVGLYRMKRHSGLTAFRGIVNYVRMVQALGVLVIWAAAVTVSHAQFRPIPNYVGNRSRGAVSQRSQQSSVGRSRGCTADRKPAARATAGRAGWSRVLVLQLPANQSLSEQWTRGTRPRFTGKMVMY